MMKKYIILFLSGMLGFITLSCENDQDVKL